MKGLNADHRHEVSSDQDLLALLDANIGIGFLPRTVHRRPAWRGPAAGFDLGRTVCLYGVAGRQRTPVAATFMKMLRAAKWPSQVTDRDRIRPGGYCSAAIRSSIVMRWR